MTFNEGTEVVLNHPQRKMVNWIGLRCRVVKNVNCPADKTFLEPLSARPDGRNYEDFFWITEYLKEA
jgi:hypothetical protein